MSILKRLLCWSSIIMGVLAIIYFLAAFVMIFWQQPQPSAIGQMVAEADLNMRGTQIEQQEMLFTMRDGKSLAARYFPATSQRIVLMIHGVTGNSTNLIVPAGLIREATDASVYALDLRGHGNSDGTRGDIDYIGQYEDDLADVIVEIRKDYPNHELMVAGYSMGGAITLRYAAQNHEVVDRYLLIAPNLGIDAPTARTEVSAETNPNVEPFVQLHIPRIIGIAMLDGAGVRVFNGLPTMFFNLPDNFVNVYSYRAMMNSTPDDYQAAFETITQPLLVVVGSADETMIAEAFPALVSDLNAEVKIINGETHNGILYSQAMIDAVQNWMPSIEAID